jgi:hypothetical protein
MPGSLGPCRPYFFSFFSSRDPRDVTETLDDKGYLKIATPATHLQYIHSCPSASIRYQSTHLGVPIENIISPRAGTSPDPPNRLPPTPAHPHHIAKMSSLVTTIIICVVLVVVIGSLILTCALGWTRILGCIIPDRLRKKSYPAKQSWFNDTRSNVPTPDPEKTEFKGEPVTSPDSSPVASPVGSPRASRYGVEDTLMKSSKASTRYSTKSSKMARYSTDEMMKRCSLNEMV